MSNKLLRLATVRTSASELSGEDHRASELNFNLAYCPRTASALYWSIDPSGGDSAGSINVDVYRDHALGEADEKLLYNVTDGHSSLVQYDDNLYAGNPKGATSHFMFSCYAVLSESDAAFVNAHWMDDRRGHLGSKKLCEVCLPGSHDSGTYGISMHSPNGNDLSIAVPDFPSSFLRWARAQGWSIAQQLNAGVRYFDLRVDHSNHMSITHSWLAEQVDIVLSDIQSFLNANRHEWVVLDFQHLYGMTDDDFTALGNKLVDRFGDKIAPPTQITPDSTVDELRSGGYQVIVIVSDDPDEHPAPSSFFAEFTMCWKRTLTLQSQWADEDDEDALLRALDRIVDEVHPSGKFWVVQGQRTPTILDYGTDPLAQESLRSWAESTTPAIVARMGDQWRSKALNIVIVDFVDLGGFVQACINRN